MEGYRLVERHRAPDSFCCHLFEFKAIIQVDFGIMLVKIHMKSKEKVQIRFNKTSKIPAIIWWGFSKLAFYFQTIFSLVSPVFRLLMWLHNKFYYITEHLIKPILINSKKNPEKTKWLFLIIITRRRRNNHLLNVSCSLFFGVQCSSQESSAIWWCTKWTTLDQDDGCVSF